MEGGAGQVCGERGGGGAGAGRERVDGRARSRCAWDGRGPRAGGVSRCAGTRKEAGSLGARPQSVPVSLTAPLPTSPPPLCAPPPSRAAAAEPSPLH